MNSNSLITKPYSDVKSKEYSEYLKRFNKTVIYLLPLVGLEITDMKGKDFNAFCMKDQYSILVEFKEDVDDDFLLQLRKKARNIRRSNGSMNKIIIKLPEEYKSEYDLFKQSKLSKFSNKAKTIIKSANYMCYTENRNQLVYIADVDDYRYECIFSFFNKYVPGNLINAIYTKRCNQTGLILDEDTELSQRIPDKEFI